MKTLIRTLLAVSLLILVAAPVLAAPSWLPDPVSDDDYYPAASAEKVELGKVLFFDKILSGNKNISCATCHHPLAGTGDGLALPIGEGGHGLGVTRDTGTGADAIKGRVPRNAPLVFNLGAKEFTAMFHDGRVAVDASQPSGFLSPVGDVLPNGLDNPLAVQAIFPITSPAEMAGQPDENFVAAQGALLGPPGVWAVLTQRLREIPVYVDMFMDAYPDEVFAAGDISIVHLGNAIGAFEAAAWRADNSRFDRYLRGDSGALSKREKKGMKLFYGKANCSSCHSGPFQTDQSYHAIAMPQIGPGKGDNSVGYADGQEDFGRERVTGDSSDRFKFRTPSLRNVALSGPYGHNGAFDTLEAIIDHYVNSVDSINNYDQSQARLPTAGALLDAKDFVVMSDPVRIAEIAARNELATLTLKKKEVALLIEFLHALTDASLLDMRADVPLRVPSGLPLAE